MTICVSEMERPRNESIVLERLLIFERRTSVLVTNLVGVGDEYTQQKQVQTTVVLRSYFFSILGPEFPQHIAEEWN